jgi:membrane protein implicated in regulation of membrane protease activity
MDTEQIITLIWLIAAILLMVSEIILPGLITLFLGLGALTVAILRYTEVISGNFNSIIYWILISLIYLIFIRSLFMKFFGGETSYKSINEDAEAFGMIVKVMEPVRPDNADGRIWFQGSSWPATSTKEEIPAGKEVRIIHRDNIAWVVEPVDK